jgi:hypothetical protein
MKFNELLNSLINEQDDAAYKPTNPTESQLMTYFARTLNTKEGREEIVSMLADIYSASEGSLLEVVEEYYQTIRSKATGLQQRNAPLGRAKIISSSSKRVASKKAKPVAPQPGANKKFPQPPPADPGHPIISSSRG